MPRLLLVLMIVNLGALRSAEASCSAVCTPNQVFTVNSTKDLPRANICSNDCNAADGTTIVCTLRAAIQQATACAAEGDGPNTILVPPGIYMLATYNAGDPDDDAHGDLDIYDDLYIRPDTSNGVGPVIVDARNSQSRVFDLHGPSNPESTEMPANVYMEGLVIRNGDAASGPGGGGINVAASALTMVRSSVLYNTGAAGGGIYIAGNASSGSSEFIPASATFYNSTIAYNSTFPASNTGGGVYVEVGGEAYQGSMTSYFSTIANNTSINGSGGATRASYGAGIYQDGAGNGLVELADSIVTGNVNVYNDGTTPDDIDGTGVNPFVDGTFSLVGTCDCDTTNPEMIQKTTTFGAIAAFDSTSDNWNDYVLSIDASSPAIDAAAPATLCADTRNTPDERNATRPVDGNHDGVAACDLGAFEYQGNDVSVLKTASATTVQPGETITYTIAVSNLFDAQPSAVPVVDTLPAGETFVSATADDGSPCTFAAPTVTCTIAALAQAQTVHITIIVTALTEGALTNTASTGSGFVDDNGSNNASSVTVNVVGQANTKLLKTASAAKTVVGQVFTYTLVVSNAGPDTATQVVVTDPLPSGVNFQSAASTVGTCTSSDGITVTCDIGSLAVGASATVTIQVLAAAAGTATNTATLQQNEVDPTPDNQPTAVTTIEGVPTLAAATPINAGNYEGGGVRCSSTRSTHAPNADAALLASVIAVAVFGRRRRRRFS